MSAEAWQYGLSEELALVGPRHGAGVCTTCFNLTDGHPRCHACTRSEPWLDAVLPISYSVSGSPLHRALAGYKRFTGAPAQRLRLQLSVVLDLFLTGHELCLARRCGVEHFTLVTAVPSGNAERDRHHPLPLVAGRLAVRTRGRYERLLTRSHLMLPPRTFHRRKYRKVRFLAGASVLLLDDTWASGTSAQSAAAALKSAGAAAVGCVVLGRHLTAGWHGNEQRVSALQPSFSWQSCPECQPELSGPTSDAPIPSRPPSAAAG